MSIRSDGINVGSDSVDTLGRIYARRGPTPQPREAIGKPTGVRLTCAERALAAALADEDESTISEVLREGLELLARSRHFRRVKITP